MDANELAERLIEAIEKMAYHQETIADRLDSILEHLDASCIDVRMVDANCEPIATVDDDE
jgi:hypothetical protein